VCVCVCVCVFKIFKVQFMCCRQATQVHPLRDDVQHGAIPHEAFDGHPQDPQPVHGDVIDPEILPPSNIS
jgi:hypothetical protein